MKSYKAYSEYQQPGGITFQSVRIPMIFQTSSKEISGLFEVIDNDNVQDGVRFSCRSATHLIKRYNGQRGY